MSVRGTFRSISAAVKGYEREALKRQRELEREQKNLATMKELERAYYEVQVYNNNLDVLTSLHKQASGIIDWNTIKEKKPPIKPTKSSHYEEAAKSRFESYKPNFLDKLFNRVEKKKIKHEAAVSNGIKKDEINYQELISEYEQELMEWNDTSCFAKRILSGDLDAYTEALNQVNPINEINQLGSLIKFNIENRDLIKVDLFVNSETVIPKESKYLLKNGRLSGKKITKTNYYAIYQDYVCSAVLRVARGLFALLPIRMVIVTAIGELLNTATGYFEQKPILSVALPKETLENINFEWIDPSDSMDNFLYNMKFYKTKGFTTVERILL